MHLIISTTLHVTFSVAKSLYIYVIVNHLNLKYIRRSAMAGCLTHLTKDVRGTPFESFLNFPPLDVNVCLGIFLACYSQRF